MNLMVIAQYLRRVLALSVVSLAIVSGLLFGWGADASASQKAAEVMQNRAEQELDRVAGAGTANQIEGRAEADLGRVQQEIDKVVSQVEDTTKRVQGRAQKDIGRTQQAIENTAENTQESAEGFVDSLKGFFNQ